MLNNFDINSIIQVLIFVVISGQLYYLQITYKSDHERRKKQSTIEYINQIRDKYRPLSIKLSNKFDTNTINLEQIDNDIKSDIRELLSVMEHMSVGINTGVYDFEILHRMSGSYLVRTYHQLLPYIVDRQKDNKSAYIEFETLCKKIDDLKKSNHISNFGNINFS
jgi:hypothetical protein